MKLARFGLAAAVIAAFSLSDPSAYALQVQIDDFLVVKNGATLMHDDFSDTAGLGVAGPMTEPPNPGGKGIYGSGSLPPFAGQSETGNGLRTLDTALAPLAPTPFPNSPGPAMTRSALATLITNTQPLPPPVDSSHSTNGLKQDDVIRIQGIFNLVAPTMPFEQYSISLSDNVSASVLGNDSVAVSVFQTSAGVNQVRISRRDFSAGMVQASAGVALTPADFLNAQIVLILDNTISDPTTFVGKYAFLDDGVFDTETVNTIPGLSVTLFNGEDWTRAGFAAITPAPEPASLALLGLGLAGLGFLRRRRAAQQLR